jgi:lipoate-protein ligase A
MSGLLWCCDGAHRGAENMERDRALWQMFEADPRPGVRLRFYRWDPPALSLGFHQPEDSVDRMELQRRGYDLVRRPTGGAAVLHVDELTYSISAPLGLAGLGRGVLEIHGAIAAVLAEAFRGVGVDVDFGGDGVPRDFACFSGAGGHEMTLGGKKLVGSALRRGRGAFLQHGSILGSSSHLDLTDFIAGADVDARRVARAALEAKTCTLPGLDAPEFAARLAEALAGRCGIEAHAVDRFEALLQT